MLGSEEQLLERARAGDAQAFEELIRPHVGSIRRFAYAFARRQADADDLAQEALIKALDALGSYEARSSLRTWLYTLTRNVCCDYYRSRLGRRRESEDSLDAAPESEGPADSLEPPDELLASKSEADQLWVLLKQLAPEFRIPLVLYEVEGMSYDEIAKIERVPVGTVRSRLARGRQQLKARVAGSLALSPASTLARNSELCAPESEGLR